MIPEKKNIPESLPNLSFYTLGRFEIHNNNTDSYIPSSRSSKLWELFKFLLANRGTGMPPEIILENLFSDETYENPKNALQNIIYRLRKLMLDEHIFNEYDCSISFSNGCYSLTLSNNIWLDTDMFEQYLKNADLYKRENIQKASNFYEKAIALYRGDYFPELIYDDWVIPKRNYYRRLYIQAVLELSKIYKQKKAYDDSILICEKAIQIEPYEEDLHISFMDGLIGKGKINEAQKHYGYITALLYKQFGIKPTFEMQKVYHLLKNNQERCNESISVDDLDEDETQNGAFYCNNKTFRSLFIIEKRRNERTNDSVLLVSFTIENNNANDSSSRMQSIFESFLIFLLKSLRKGDVVTTWDNSRLLVLLPKRDYKAVRIISERIIREFQSKNEVYSNIEIKAGFHPFLP